LEIRNSRVSERLQKAFAFLEKEGLTDKAIREGVND